MGYKVTEDDKDIYTITGDFPKEHQDWEIVSPSDNRFLHPNLLRLVSRHNTSLSE